jgi:hypothetical protein
MPITTLKVVIGIDFLRVEISFIYYPKRLYRRGLYALN